MSEFERKKILVWCLGLYAVTTLLAMAPMNIGAALVFLGLIFSAGSFSNLKKLFVKEYRENRGSRIFLKLSLLLAGACALSLLAALIWPVWIGKHQIQIRFFPDLLKAWYLFWPFVLVVAIRQLKSRDVVQVLSIWIFTFLVMAVIGVIQHKTGWPRKQPIPLTSLYHSTLFLGHHLSIASILIFPFFATLELLSNREKAKCSWVNKKLLWVGAIAGAITLYATYSRTLWLALPLGILIWLLGVIPKKWRAPSVVTAGLLAIAASQLPMIQSRLNSQMGQLDRYRLWQVNYEFFKARPLTGVGWKHTYEAAENSFKQKETHGEIYFVGHAHNMVLEMAAGTGIVGLLAWLFWVGGTLYLCWKAVKASKTAPNLGWGIFCALIVLQLNGLTQVNFWEGKVIHQLMWVMAWVLLWQKWPKSGKA